jgi:hypothetical protein
MSCVMLNLKSLKTFLEGVIIVPKFKLKLAAQFCSSQAYWNFLWPHHYNFLSKYKMIKESVTPNY